jgi:peroxiredoxin/uncharacterized membrane protein YphA (DoxX/SURF4 family)
MELLLLIIRLVLFAVFALAGLGKFLDLKGAEKAVKDFGTPGEFAKPFAILLPFAEIVFAFCFLFPSTSWVGALGGLILLVSFTAGMIWQVRQGNAPDCHCFGQMHSEPVSRKAIVRNIIFSLLALILVVRGRAGQGQSLADGDSDSMQLILIFSVLILLAAALFYLRRLVESQGEILRRIELLEVVAGQGVPLERQEAGNPSDGLPIGAPFPDFELKDVQGRPASLEKLLATRRPSVFFFVSPTCEPCRALLPDLERWDAELGERINFVLFSTGDAESNAGKFAVFSDDVLLQEKREVAEAVQARWTPSALFVRGDGTIGSHVAAGDRAIHELIDKLRHGDLTRNAFFTVRSNNGDRPPKIGERVGEFSLLDLKGNTITAETLRGKRTLAVFWSLTCPHCTEMMSELAAWDAARSADDPNLIVFSDGSVESHASLKLKSPVVIDPGYETANKLGMFGTPSAVVVDETGTIVTETAMGASNIWALVGRRPNS